MISRFFEPFAEEQFRIGLTAGLAATAAVMVAVLVVAVAKRRLPVGIAAAAFVPAGAYALSQIPRDVEPGIYLPAALAVLAGAGALPRLLRLPFWAGVPVAAAGGWIIGSQWTGPHWATVMLVAMVAVAGPSLVDVDRRWPDATPALVVITAGGLYATLPDTETALAFLGALLPLALFGWPLRWASVGVFGAAFCGLVAWVVAVDGIGRETSMIGGAACVGLLALEPLASRVKRRLGWPVAGPSVSTVWLIGTHLGVVLVCSRVAGLQEDLTPAAIVAALALVVGAAVAPVPPSRSALINDATAALR